MTALFFFASLLLCVTEEAKPTSLSLPVLSNRLASIAKKHNHWDNDIQRSQQYGRLIETLEEELAQIEISFVVPIQSITWKDGIAEITTEPFFKKSKRDSLLRLVRPHGFPRPSFYVYMAEDEAAAIKPKAKLSVAATLTFEAKNDKGDFPQGRHLDTFWRVTSLTYHGATLGRFQTDALSLAIGDKKLKPIESSVKQIDDEKTAATAEKE